MILLWAAILVASLVLLVKSSDWFTISAEQIGLCVGLSPFVVGATIVAVGSSMPELATSMITMLSHDMMTGFAIDNIIGSNVANLLLIGGITSVVVKSLHVRKSLIDVDFPFLFSSSALFFLFISDGKFTWFEGALSLLMLGFFVAYTISKDAKEPQHTGLVDVDNCSRVRLSWKTFAMLILGSVGIYFGADYTIISLMKLSEMINILPSVITMLAVAVGTSLPELVISIRAARKGKHAIAIGNIFGSNIFNMLAVAGIPSLFGTLTVSPQAQTIGIPFFIIATFAFIFAALNNQVRNWEGFGMLVLYAAFVLKLVGMV